ncbi:MAG: glycosyltransferase family 2 protein, partial [Acidobacteriota bacterium]
MKLAIAIPALNEEDSIQSIIERSLGAVTHIQQNSPVTDVEVTVVSDGSTDKTVERASQFSERIRLIVFPKNKGYGAAIKAAWDASDADLVGFLDADGTCEPKFFANLCSALEEQKLDVILGCRLNKDSQMPLVRRFGNFLFATLLTYLAQSRVKDTASGMRVVRRTSLNHLMPLPDGLHFTPAMSARAMMSGTLRIGEIDMPYHERVGESKLRVIKDGLRFLRVILVTALLYRPSRPITLVGLVTGLAAALMMISPLLFYVQHHLLEEWMIYRF